MAKYKVLRRDYEKINQVFSNQNGYISEDTEEGSIQIMVKCTRNLDGIVSNDYHQKKINYKTGLYQDWAATGYYANYYEQYKNRKTAMQHGLSLLKVI